MIKNVNGELFRQMVTNGAINLKNNQAIVDELNVFPVPDGDTGTNMCMTIMSGVTEIEKTDTDSIIDLAKIFSRGLLMGARGNSGVILSQFFRGLNIGLKEIGSSDVTISEFVDCLVKGYKTAYQAVSSPVEGTILTVMRESGEYIDAKKDQYSSLAEVFEDYVSAANKSLENTPNLLAQLKEAGVVDSGAAGFTYIITGMKEAVSGNLLSVSDKKEPVKEELAEPVFQEYHKTNKYPYELEFYIVVKTNQIGVDDLRSPLSIISNKLEIIEDGDTIKIMMNTNNPSRALGIAQRLGDLVIVSVTNTKEEYKDVVKNFGNSKKEKYGVIAVCFGEGVKKAFEDLGADVVIDGGQTMNPSTETFVNAVNNMNVENVIIIPNNSNIIMAASQTKQICDGKNIEVIKTKNICHGYAALSVFDKEAELEENLEAMNESIQMIDAIEVTYAVRDTSINGVEIHENDFMAIVNDEIISSNKDIMDAVKKGLDASVTEDSFIVTIFAGKDATKEQIEEIENYLTNINPDITFEVIDGKQDIYTFIISVQ